MITLKSTTRLFAVTGLLGIAAALLSAQGASAFGGMGAGFGGLGNGGGFHAEHGGGRGATAFGGGRGFGSYHVGGGDRTPGLTRLPPRPPIVRLPPAHIPPIVRLPPSHIPPIVVRPPYHVPPVIVRLPPRPLPPPVVVRVPPRILPPPVVIGQAPPAVVIGGRSVVVAQGIRPVAAIAGSAGCIADGSFVSVVFVPTVTAADITTFLRTYNVTVADGPNVDGIYRIRLSSVAMPANEVLKVVDSMRTQTAIVATVDGV